MNRASLILLLALTACNVTPEVSEPNGWYVPNTHLKQKAVEHRVRSMDLINKSGLLLYSAYLPFTDETNYLDSHNIADAPAWHGALMMSIALKLAVDGSSADQDDLELLADGLLKYYEITGQPGLIGRSYLNDYTGPRLDWMSDKEARPTKYWMRGKGNRWWRNGLAKGHLSWSVMGCGLPLILERLNRIELRSSLREKLKAFMLPAVKRLVDGEFRYRDHDGGFTEFGDLRPDVSFGPDWPAIKGLPNGFNRAVVLAMLAGCVGHDAELSKLYADRSTEWADGIGSSLELMGEVIRKLGHSERKTGIGKPSYSDMQLFGISCFVVMVQENRRTVLKGLHKGMVGLWEFMRYERNPLFTLPYWMARPDEAMSRYQDVERDLRDFPMPDQKIARSFKKRNSSRVQPLINRTTNTHYWKSSPFRHVVDPGEPMRHPKTGAINYFSGQDYLLAYWLGRFLNIVPED